jgi:molybdenum cofactor biosynthesis enzyme MoaA
MNSSLVNKKKIDKLKIKELRLVVTSNCPYSCRYCNLYYKKALAAKKISRPEFDKRYIIGNESYSLLLDDSRDSRIFNLGDYKFLFSVLHSYFGLEDITFTGGDPFLNNDLKKIVALAAKVGVRTTAITKGAPLFVLKNSNQARDKIGQLSRIIFSVDTLDSKKYADNNLPLVDASQALAFLPNTLAVIKVLANAKYNIELNSVIMPLPKNKKDLLDSFAETDKIISFCLNNKVRKVKFIELDSPQTLGQPYIETYFKKMFSLGFLDKYLETNKGLNKENVNFASSVTKICVVPRSLKAGGEMGIFAYRTHCPATFINNKTPKKCEFSQGGELHLDFMGRSFLCQKNSNFKFIDIYMFVKNRDLQGLLSGILLINQEIDKQKCRF